MLLAGTSSFYCGAVADARTGADLDPEVDGGTHADQNASRK
jgi:hypothetical protein